MEKTPDRPDRASIRKRVMWQPHINENSTDNPYPGRPESKRFSSLTYRMQRDAEADRAELLAELDRLDPNLDCSTREKLFNAVDRILEALQVGDTSGLDRLREILDSVDPPVSRRKRLFQEIRAVHVRKSHLKSTAVQNHKVLAPWHDVNDTQRLLLSLYATDPKIVDTVYDLIARYHTLPKFCTVLEPSAGRGAFIDGYMRNLGRYPTRLTAVDILRDNITHLRKKYSRISAVTDLDITDATDFLTWRSHERFDLVIGCPPAPTVLEPYADIKHLIHAYSFVEVGGVLAFVMPTSAEKAPKNLQRQLEHILGNSVITPLCEYDHVQRPLCLVLTKRV